MAPTVLAIFMHDVPPEIVAEAFARGSPASPTPYPPSPGHWSGGRTVRPVLAGRHDRLFPLEFVRGLALERLNIVADVIDTGHLPALSRPDELVRRPNSESALLGGATRPTRGGALARLRRAGAAALLDSRAPHQPLPLSLRTGCALRPDPVPQDGRCSSGAGICTSRDPRDPEHQRGRGR
jgi:hypothetical protein